MLKILLALLLAVALILGGKLLFRVFVTDRVVDKGGMENPWAVEEPEENPAQEEITETYR